MFIVFRLKGSEQLKTSSAMVEELERSDFPNPAAAVEMVAGLRRHPSLTKFARSSWRPSNAC
jgi:hypothetical protein